MTETNGRARVTFLGTGNAFGIDGRFTASTLLEWGDRRILMDAGPTVQISLQRLGIGVGDLDAVFLTHLHGDHFGGMPFLTITRCYVEENEGKPFVVYGPIGTRERLEQLWACTYGDVKGVPQPEVFEIERRLGSVDALGIRVEIVPMVHLPHSIGFRFLTDQGSICISGDTRYVAENIEALCDGIDVAILECTMIERERYSHISLQDIREFRDRLRCRQLVISHITDDVAAALAAAPINDTRSVEDGDVVEVG